MAKLDSPGIRPSLLMTPLLQPALRLRDLYSLNESASLFLLLSLLLLLLLLLL